ncbi:nitrogen fixation protein FixH [Pseudorhizobium tarimense]|uniref:Nitrogen fixation protein FixH n=1 Tax=Pseudorhizobium tarimense TaxID=1079109 RepID=A0ABV2H3D8_9HYPH|nr:FixH family protein [Pseudorhizobium tarimense]MCJ8518051.1 FixH family protein [Pseudorhizobium tarimense]
MNSTQEKSFVFTGWHMVGVMVLFFGTIISANFYMAWQATHSWSGLVVQNTCIASQEFNGKVAEAKALAATGLSGEVSIEGDQIRYRIKHPQGLKVEADALTLNFKRPVGEYQDFTLQLQRVGGGVFEARHAVLPGAWIVEANATEGGKRILHHTERVSVDGGQR